MPAVKSKCAPRKPKGPDGRQELIRGVFRPPTRQTVSEWAEANRVLGDESAEPGRWRNRRTPYLAAPMDSFNDPETEMVVCCFAAQLGKTEILLNFLGYVIDQDPGTTLLVYPTEKQADKVIRHRVHPLILNSPAVRKHLRSECSDNLALKEIDFDRMTLFTAWSNSPGALSSTPVRNLLMDEVDKFPPYAGREANPIKLAQVRTRTFRGRRKIGITSSPTLDTGYIWIEFERSDGNQYWVPCPKCGAYQVLDFFKGVKWPKEIPGSKIYEENLAWYECAGCKAELHEEEKAQMIAGGVWAPRGVQVLPGGKLEGKAPPRRRRGFHLSVLYSPFVTWSETACEFLDSKDDASLLQNFFNSWLAQPWREKLESVTEAKIRAARRNYPAGTAPAGARVLTAGVDVQADVLYFVIRAWGLAERSWLVRHGQAVTWDDLWKALAQGYTIGDGQVLHVERAMVDSGFRTPEVYAWTSKHRPITWPSKGSGNPALVTSIRTSKPEPGVLLYTFKADFFKDRLSRLISSKPDEPGEWAVHTGVDEEYLKHMTSERRVIKRQAGRRTSTWEPLTESTPNHYWDCEVLAILAADAIGVRYLAGGSTPAPQAPRTPRGPKEKESWMGEREGRWIGGGSIWGDG